METEVRRRKQKTEISVSRNFGSVLGFEPKRPRKQKNTAARRLVAGEDEAEEGQEAAPLKPLGEIEGGESHRPPLLSAGVESSRSKRLKR